MLWNPGKGLVNQMGVGVLSDSPLNQHLRRVSAVTVGNLLGRGCRVCEEVRT